MDGAPEFIRSHDHKLCKKLCWRRVGGWFVFLSKTLSKFFYCIVQILFKACQSRVFLLDSKSTYKVSRSCEGEGLDVGLSLLKKYYNISTSSQYVTLDNKIKCLSLASSFFLFFGNPTNRTVTVYTWELLIANHLDQSEILSCSQVQLITLFFGGAQLCCAFYQPWQAAWIWCKKTSFLS